ncbi:condensation domain-containing protein [Leptolyngbya boryana CZ1]|uniref:Condensation domain-containing protein n=1 Tax=Leptolyngbya boryana CZ1 TaxID=3060204 RepID=A0AA97AKY9_LEPBY|nr:condensation domain-containing protein [Leptolyngbya boryana]WNZ43598.1 condensation domain-containing protein [Leptolyngbya boryana CZ1]
MVNFSRKLGLVENLFATLHSMGAMIYVNIASIQGVISLDVLRSAMDLLQKRHPLLQVHLQESDDGVSFCADGTLRIPLTAIERQHEQQWLEIAEGELLQKFSGEFDPLCRITLLQAFEQSGQNELIVTFHHAIADGISALHFVHELLSYYQQLAEGSPISPIESLPLLPSLEQLLSRP